MHATRHITGHIYWLNYHHIVTHHYYPRKAKCTNLALQSGIYYPFLKKKTNSVHLELYFWSYRPRFNNFNRDTMCIACTILNVLKWLNFKNIPFPYLQDHLYTRIFVSVIRYSGLTHCILRCWIKNIRASRQLKYQYPQEKYHSRTSLILLPT